MSPESADELTDYLHGSIPLTAVMGVRVVETSWEAAVLAAPFRNNVNHEGTFFGASQSALALLAGFAALRRRLQARGHQHRIVVQQNTYSYEHPVTTDISARAEIFPARWEELLDRLKRRGRGRITVDVAVHDASDRRVGLLTGSFALLPAALPEPGPDNGIR